VRRYGRLAVTSGSSGGRPSGCGGLIPVTMCVGGLMSVLEWAVRRRRVLGAVRSVVLAGVVATVLAGLTPPGLLGPAPAWSATVRTVAVVSPVGPSVVRPALTGPAPGPGGGSGGGGESNPAPSPGGHKESSGSSGSGSSDSKPAPKPAADSGAAKSSDGGNQPAPKPAAENAASKPSDGGTQPTTAPAPGPRNEPQQGAAGTQPTPAPAPGARPDAQPAAGSQQPTVAPAAAPPPPGATPPGNNGGPTVAPAAPPRPVPPGGTQLAADQTPLGARPPPATPSGSLAERQAVGPLTPEVVSGPNKLTMDPTASGLVNDYRKTLPSDVSAGQLNFGSTPVAAPRWNQLVGQEGGDVGKFNSMVHEVGGPNPQVTQTPLLLRSDKGEFGTASLFQVKGADGKTTLVDGQGAKYTGMNDYLDHNELDDSWTMVRPANPGAPAGEQGQLISGPAHNTTMWQKVGKAGDKIAEPMVAAGSALVGGAAVAELASVGAATPVAATAAAVGGGMMAVGGGWMALRSGSDLIDRYQHGRSLSLADPQARADYLGIAGGVGGAAGNLTRALGATSAVTRAADGTALGAGGAMTVSESSQLYHDWDKLSPDQRSERLGQIALNVGLLRRSGASREAGPTSPQGGEGQARVVPDGPVSKIADPSQVRAEAGDNDPGLTSRAARRQAMREAGIPTSDTPVKQTNTPAGRQYEYLTPQSNGGPRRQVVTDQTTDRVADHGPHWEAGPVKHPDEVPENRDPLGRLRVTNDKSKVYYRGK